jgi:hypothetical protein
MRLGSILIDRRFRGPPNSGNGGYSCGRLAAFIDGTAEVTLRRPPPLETAMDVVAQADGTVALYDREHLIASAMPAEVAADVSVLPTFEEAAAASARTFPPAAHRLPMCYVCGPHRARGDGLRIHCGPLDPSDIGWNGVVAAPWVPESYMATDGEVAVEFIWACLDCPTAYAAGSAEGFPSILLGRQAVHIDRRPRPGEQCVVTAWETGRDGRKYRAQAALIGADREAIAFCRATWIEVTRDVLIGATA